MIRQPEEFKVPIARPAKVGPEQMAFYWNPWRASIKFAPDWFRERLKNEMGDELEITWNPILERWQVWMRSPRVQHPLCSGWKLLFIHNGPSGEYLPLDERLLARLYAASAAKWGDGRKYFDHIMREMERDREAYERSSTQDAIDAAMPFYEYSQIKNIGRGSKFSEYFA